MRRDSQNLAGWLQEAIGEEADVQHCQCQTQRRQVHARQIPELRSGYEHAQM